MNPIYRYVRRLALLLLIPLSLLLCSCESSGGRATNLQGLAEELSRAFVALKATEYLAEERPELIPVLDKNGDHLVDVDELLALQELEPGTLAAIIALLEQGKGG